MNKLNKEEQIEIINKEIHSIKIQNKQDKKIFRLSLFGSITTTILTIFSYLTIISSTNMIIWGISALMLTSAVWAKSETIYNNKMKIKQLNKDRNELEGIQKSVNKRKAKKHNKHLKTEEILKNAKNNNKNKQNIKEEINANNIFQDKYYSEKLKDLEDDFPRNRDNDEMNPR